MVKPLRLRLYSITCPETSTSSQQQTLSLLCTHYTLLHTEYAQINRGIWHLQNSKIKKGHATDSSLAPLTPVPPLPNLLASIRLALRLSVVSTPVTTTAERSSSVPGNRNPILIFQSRRTHPYGSFVTYSTTRHTEVFPPVADAGHTYILRTKDERKGSIPSWGPRAVGQRPLLCRGGVV